jgi:hypothetical protein
VSTYGQHVGIAKDARPLRDLMEISYGNRLRAAVDHEHGLEAFRAARAEMAAFGQAQLDEARHHVARDANRHCRRLGLPTNYSLDAEDWADGVHALREAYRSASERLMDALRPLVRAASAAQLSAGSVTDHG